jgi:hypothetical protein
MKARIIIELSTADKATAERAASRLVEIELGMRRSTHRVHKNKKAYSRKAKHK